MKSAGVLLFVALSRQVGARGEFFAERPSKPFRRVHGAFLTASPICVSAERSDEDFIALL